MTFVRAVIAFANRPAVMFTAGALLVLTSLFELGQELYTFAEGPRSEHGTLFYGLILTIQNLGNMGSGVQMVDTGRPRGE